MTGEQRWTRARLEAAVARVSVPVNLQRRRSQSQPDPASGQIWRADWDNVAVLVAVVGVENLIASVPLTLDTDSIFGAGVVIDAASNPLSVPLVAWPELQRGLPAVVLAEFFGQLDDAGRRVIAERRPTKPSEEAVDPAMRLYIAMMEDSIDALASTSWQVEGSGELRFRLSGLTPALLASTLGTTPQRALALRRGTAVLTVDEAALLAPVLGRSVDELLAGNPRLPTDLVERLEQPHRHRQIRLLAEQRATDLSSTYRYVATGVWTLAARQTGAQSGNAWDGRIDTFLAAVLK